MNENQKKHIIEVLTSESSSPDQHKITIGFDGYIDHIFSVVEKRLSNNRFSEYHQILDFSKKIADSAGKSADIEIVQTDKKLGGNAPIMANAVARAGSYVCCIGAMGYPAVDPVFSQFPEACEIQSMDDPAYTYAFEFDDGKLMFANLSAVEALDWETIKMRISEEKLRSLFTESDLIALVNWNFIYNMQDIWQKLRDEILNSADSRMETKIFFDLADPSKRIDADIIDVLKLIGDYGQNYRVTLGLNENEALKIYGALCRNSTQPTSQDDTKSIEEIGEFIFHAIQIEAVVIHLTDYCLSITTDGVKLQYGKRVENPVLLTGGGDNFNAGYCLGWLLNLPPEECMILAMAVSYFYVKNGYSPTKDEMIDTINHV